MKNFDQANDIQYQLVPPHIHRRNAAERAIRTWKNHFIAGLCSIDTDFPQHLWDRLTDQAQMTLNLLRPSRRNPHISAYTALEGTFDFNRTPMAPPGTKVLIHEKSGQRQSWDPHATEGWYLGPANDHYRCYRVFTNKTKAERIIDTIECFPQHTTVPYIIQALKNPTPSTAFTHVSSNQHEAIKALADIFHKHITPQPTKQCGTSSEGGDAPPVTSEGADTKHAPTHTSIPNPQRHLPNTG
jgi:hypothetical protein